MVNDTYVFWFVVFQDSSSLSCAMQLYHCAEAGLSVLQMRSGLLPGSSASLCEDLVTWARSRGVTRLVSLTSSLAHERQESQLQGPSLRYLATEGVTVSDNFVKLEPRTSLHGLPVDNHQEVNTRRMPSPRSMKVSGLWEY